MNPRKLISLTFSEWTACFAALATVTMVRIGLTLFPLRNVCGIVYSLNKALLRRSLRKARASTVTPALIAKAVTVAARMMPVRTTCLPQALSAHILLAAHGFDSRLQIGIARSNAKPLAAHAWVELNGDVIVGVVPGLTEFRPLPDLSGILNDKAF
jgi:hypothetical protein